MITGTSTTGMAAAGTGYTPSGCGVAPAPAVCGTGGGSGGLVIWSGAEASHGGMSPKVTPGTDTPTCVRPAWSTGRVASRRTVRNAGEGSAGMKIAAFSWSAAGAGKPAPFTIRTSGRKAAYVISPVVYHFGAVA